MQNENDFQSVRHWGVVYSFFHPELRQVENSSDVSLSSLFSGFTSGITGATHDGSLPSQEIAGIYTGLPASLVYESYGIDDSRLYWRAEIEIASGLTIGDAVVVSVKDYEGRAIDGATLTLLGTALFVSSGMAAYNLAEFQERLDNTEVALTFANGDRVIGTLKFGEDIPEMFVMSDD